MNIFLKPKQYVNVSKNVWENLHFFKNNIVMILPYYNFLAKNGPNWCNNILASCYILVCRGWIMKKEIPRPTYQKMSWYFREIEVTVKSQYWWWAFALFSNFRADRDKPRRKHISVIRKITKYNGKAKKHKRKTAFIHPACFHIQSSLCHTNKNKLRFLYFNICIQNI